MSYFPNVPVPGVNSAGNIYQSDVVGNKSDDEAGTSLAAKGYRVDHHSHSAARVYPTMAAGVGVTKNAAPWTLGNFAVVVPTNAIASPFDIHALNFDDVPANGVYEIVLYAGPDGGEVEVGRTRFTRQAASSIEFESAFQTPLIAANSQIKAKLAGSNGAGTTIVVSLRYHIY